MNRARACGTRASTDTSAADSRLTASHPRACSRTIAQRPNAQRDTQEIGLGNVPRIRTDVRAVQAACQCKKCGRPPLVAVAELTISGVFKLTGTEKVADEVVLPYGQATSSRVHELQRRIGPRTSVQKRTTPSATCIARRETSFALDTCVRAFTGDDVSTARADTKRSIAPTKSLLRSPVFGMQSPRRSKARMVI